MRKAGWTAPILALACGLLIVSGGGVEGRPSSTRVKIGLVESITRGIPLSWTQLAMRPFKSLMEAETGMVGDVIQGGDALTLAKRLHDNKVQVGVFHGHEYAWAKQKYPKLKVIALCVNQTQAAKVYLVVPAKSRAVSFEGLKGKAISVPRMGRAPCQLYLERRCVKPGTTPEKFYQRINNPFLTAEALDDILDGEADAAVVDAVGWKEYQTSRPGAAKALRCIAESEPFPCGVIAYCPGNLAETSVRKFCVGLLKAKTTPRGRETLKTLRLTAFERAPANHDAVLAAISKAYPPPGK